MTAVSLIAPYAPQPATGIGADTGFSPAQTVMPLKPPSAGGGAGLASDQSGQGAGNGTGTGGAQLAALLKRARTEIPVDRPTASSVVEAQSKGDPATKFLERQARQNIEAKAADAARDALRAEMRAAAAKAEAAKAARPQFDLPAPIPTAPILQ